MVWWWGTKHRLEEEATARRDLEERNVLSLVSIVVVGLTCGYYIKNY
jgi:hypothetical protein